MLLMCFCIFCHRPSIPVRSQFASSVILSMRVFTLSFAVALAQLSALITAIPVAKSADAEWSETEINAPASPIADA